MSDPGPDFCVVVPTIGRPSLTALLESLASARGPRPSRIVVVDDRADPAAGGPLPVPAGGWTSDVLDIRRSGGRGPAAARNTGWRAGAGEWVAFLDDDVLVGSDWLQELATDLEGVGARAGASCGRIHVPLPAGRRPTDWERGTAGLASATWITADMAYRRAALEQAGGFDERFRRAFREDADLALRVQDRGWTIAQGRRRTTHPVRPARWRASLDQQRGNADDVLMTRLHGRDWYSRAAAPRGRRPAHLVTTAALGGAAAALVGRRRRTAIAAASVWAALTAEFAAARIAPGPRDRAEVARMVATSALIPPAATWHWVRGLLRHRRVPPWAPAGTVSAVLFDRDGTLVHDVAYNGRPDLVRPVEGAAEALERLRAAGVRLGVVTNQSGVARGLIRRADVDAVNARVDELLGPFGTWQVCPHDDADGCACRKPRPGMVLAAAAALGVPVQECVVIGDTAADVGAAAAAGARGILVPNAATRPAEVTAAAWTATDLAAAVDAVLATGGVTAGAVRVDAGAAP